MEVKQGQIYYANLSPVVGSEQGKFRPVIILQNDTGNHFSNTTIIAAITSKTEKKEFPTHVRFTTDNIKKESMVLLEHIQTIDKSRLGKFIGQIDTKTMNRIFQAILFSFGIEYLEELKNDNNRKKEFR